MTYTSPEKVEHNISLWKWYPLGQIDATWALIEHLHSQLGEEYTSNIEEILDALQRLDDKVRANNYPFVEKNQPKMNKSNPDNRKRRRSPKQK